MIDELRALVPLSSFVLLGLTLAFLALRRAGVRAASHGGSGRAGVLPAIPTVDVNPPVETELATFAMGCFYQAEARFGAMPGVVRTCVGYAGGRAAAPSYTELGDHTEVVQVEYDPAVVTYSHLLDVFWSAHDPTYRHWSRRYASILFYHDQRQRLVAEHFTDNMASRVPGKVYTEIKPLAKFHLAESWHQKHYVRQAPELESEFAAIYPKPVSWILSTAIARVNGYLGGNGRLGALYKDLGSLGLSSVGQRRLLTHWRPSVGTKSAEMYNFEDLSKSPIEP